jgi:plastocyanin
MTRTRTLASVLLALAAMAALVVFNTGAGIAQQTNPAAGGVEPHPAHIHQGTCAQLNPKPYLPLNDVRLGLPIGTPNAAPETMSGSGGAFPAETSVTQNVKTSLDDLLKNPYAINVHLSAQKMDTYIACGDIGGIRQGADLAFGLAEQTDSGYVGTAWLHDNGDGTINVTVAIVRNLIKAAAPSGTPAAGAATPAAGASPAAGPQTSVTIVMGKPSEFRFDPSDVTIPANTDVTITLKNEGSTLHNFSIDKLKISQDVQVGQTQTVKINAPAGDYQFYCDQPGHKEGGMVGTLHVVNKSASSGGAQAAAPTTAASGQGQASGQTAQTVVMGKPSEFRFDPSEFTIPANTDVTVTLKNEGATLHNFTIDKLKISQDVNVGETKTVTINAPAGDYQFYCDQPGHKEGGMVGTLHVK